MQSILLTMISLSLPFGRLYFQLETHASQALLQHIDSCCWGMQNISGLVETNPGVRSCMIEYDQRLLPLQDLIGILTTAEAELSTVCKIDLCCSLTMCHLGTAMYVDLAASLVLYVDLLLCCLTSSPKCRGSL